MHHLKETRPGILLPATTEHFSFEEFDAYDGKEVVDYHEKDGYCEHLGS